MALSALIVDAHSCPVLVKVVVVRHREHDGYLLHGILAALSDHIIGQDSNGAGEGAAGLAEVAHLSFHRSHDGLWRAVAVAVMQVDPWERARASVGSSNTNKRGLRRRPARLLLGVQEAEVVGDVGDLNGDIS